jgi:hypothetical protein
MAAANRQTWAQNPRNGGLIIIERGLASGDTPLSAAGAAAARVEPRLEC